MNKHSASNGNILRIAQVAPLFESVPPRLYGGTERVVSYLTEELVSMGHDVTLFASGDSLTSARLIPWGAKALRLDPELKEPVAAHAGMLDLVQCMQDEFDIIHFHCDFMHFPLLRHLSLPCLTTLHGCLDQKEVLSLYARFKDAALVSISNSQRAPQKALSSELNFVDTVYHGLDLNLYPPSFEEGAYFAFLGRVSPEKGLEDAIEIALRLRTKLKIAAKIDPADQAYFEQLIAPKLEHPLIEFIGEIGESQKAQFLGGARALLFPIHWAEPFGMVMIEAMACATPVIAFDNGSVREVIDEGVSGFIANNTEEAVSKIKKLNTLDRRLVRRCFERRFSQEKMAASYLGIYRELINRHKAPKDFEEPLEAELFL